MEGKENINADYVETVRPRPVFTNNHVVLIPKPSSAPNDPLNWPLSKKITTLVIVSFASFINLGQQVANSAGLFSQAALYHKKPVEISYAVSPSLRTAV